MKIIVALLLTILPILQLLLTLPVDASTSNLSLRPDSTITGGWNTNGTADGSCTGHCDYVDEVSSGNGDGNTSYVNINNQTATEAYTMQDISTGQTATSFVVSIYAECSANALFGNGGGINVTPSINGAALATSSAAIGSCSNNSWSLYNFTYNGTWTESDINSMTLSFIATKNGGLGNPTLGLSATYVNVTMREPDLDQSAARVYNNADSITPGAALASTNNTADVQKGASFRIRVGITVTDYQWTTGTWGSNAPNTYNLQFAQRSAGSCSSQTSGWSDIQSDTGAIRWHDNPSVPDNTSIGSYASDPTVTGSKVYQTYNESNPLTNTNSVTTGNTGLWGFSLQDYSSNYGTTYCFRIVQTSGSEISLYSNFPSIITVGSLDIDVVDGTGTPVVTPNTPFGAVIVQPACQQSSATLGTTSQTVRVTNNIAVNGWSLSLAATDGPTAHWSNGSNGSYDYNDGGGSPPGCTDGGDADTLAGRLSVSPSTANVTPESGCAASGVALGSDTSYSENTVDSVTLVTATSATPRFCYFSLKGVGLAQQIPTYRPKGSYVLDFTLTVLAL